MANIISLLSIIAILVGSIFIFFDNNNNKPKMG